MCRFDCEKIDIVEITDISENDAGGARGVMITVVGNGHGETSSNPGRD